MIFTETFDTAIGANQLIKGKNLLKGLNQPEFIIPEEAIKSLNVSESLAAQKSIPGMTYAQQGIDSSASGAISDIMRMADNPASALGAISRVVSNTNQNKMQLAANNAVWVNNQQDKLMGSLNDMAQWKNIKNKWDVYDPYMQQLNYAMNLINSGTQNLRGVTQSADQKAELAATMAMNYVAPGSGSMIQQGGSNTNRNQPQMNNMDDFYMYNERFRNTG